MDEGKLIEYYDETIKIAAKQFYNRYNIRKTIIDLDDLEQEARISLLAKIRKNDTICYNYVKIIAFTAFIDTLRRELKRGKNKINFVPIENRHENDGNTLFEDIDKMMIIRKASNIVCSKKTFTANEKIAFNLRYLDGWTQEMIGNFLGHPQNSIVYWLRKTTKYVITILRAPKRRMA
jgi:RNA polymerase sigma factor (sigma-70 family)